VKTFRGYAESFLTGSLTYLTFSLVFTTGCTAGRMSPNSLASSQILLDAALAEDVIDCAERQFRAGGYATHRDPRNPRMVQGDLETSTAGSGYEVNVARAYLTPVDGNSKLLQWGVQAETRQFKSRGSLVGYEIRTPPRGEVMLLTRQVTETCAKA
jgi:hypothetical protein